MKSGDPDVAAMSGNLEISPCSYCGSVSELFGKHGSWGYTNGSVWIECSGKKCGAVSPKFGCESHQMNDPEAIGRAVKWWNRRPLDT